MTMRFSCLPSSHFNLYMADIWIQFNNRAIRTFISSLHPPEVGTGAVELGHRVFHSGSLGVAAFFLIELT